MIEAGRYLSVSYRGDCAQNEDYIPRLLAYAAEHGYALQGPFLELLWTDIHQAAEEKEHITELQIKVGRA